MNRTTSLTTLNPPSRRAHRRTRTFPFFPILVLTAVLFFSGFFLGRQSIMAAEAPIDPAPAGSQPEAPPIQPEYPPPATKEPEQEPTPEEVKNPDPSDENLYFELFPGSTQEAIPPSTSGTPQQRETQQVTPPPPTAPPPVKIENESDSDWNLLLVNKDHPIPEDHAPELTYVGNYRFDIRAAAALRDMLAAAQAEGLSPIVCSAYRSVDYQTTLYENQVSKYLGQGYSQADAERLAGTKVAVPGTSEHHTGLAADIVALSYQHLEKDQENTAEAIWLRDNCHRFGFILRYPEDKQDVTGIIYEPWHYRYVGVDAATQIMEQGLCLEEYLAQ